MSLDSIGIISINKILISELYDGCIYCQFYHLCTACAASYIYSLIDVITAGDVGGLCVLAAQRKLHQSEGLMLGPVTIAIGKLLNQGNNNIITQEQT